MKHFFLLIAGLLLAAAGILAQPDYRQRQLTMDDGLPSNSVSNILQDTQGFLWIGTEKGLCRYDGQALQSYRTPGGAAHQRVISLQPDGTDRLFVAMSQGVYSFSLRTEQFQKLPLELTAPVTHLSKDADGNLWVSTMGQGVVCYGGQDAEPQRYELAEAAGRVDAVYTDANNQQWALCTQGKVPLWRLNKGRNMFEPVSIRSDVPYASMCMLQARDGSRWLGTWEHGLMLLHDNGELEPMPVPSTGHCLHIRTLNETERGQLLVGSDDGLWLFDPRRHTYSLHLPQRFVQAVGYDREGGLWVGTSYGGLTYVSPIAHRFDATPGGITSRFCEDRRGRIWVASDDVGISCYLNGQRQDHFPGQQQLQQLNIHALCMDGDDLWIGTFSDGVYVLSTITGQLRHHTTGSSEQTLFDNNSYAIFRDRQGRMWVGTQQGLCRYDRTSGRFERVATLKAAAINMAEDRQGRLWVATQGAGLYRYDRDGHVEQYQHSTMQENTLNDNTVNCVVVGADGTVWAGTQGGLCRYDSKIDDFRRTRLDVPKQAVAAIVEDQGALWISGDCGVLKYTPGGGVLRFTRQDGLVSEQFQPNACLKASDGRIFFGTISGFNSFFPYQIKVNQLKPPVYITRLEFSNNPIDVGNWRLPMSLPFTHQLDIYYNDRVFSLSFASLSYCSPEKNMYAYMLEGFDKDWTYVGHGQKATYTNLSAGTYTFRVRATNNDGIWSDSEATLKVVVHPPFWWGVYAKIFYVLLAIGLMWLYIYLRLTQNERRHRREMTLLSEAKEQELRDARMKFFTMIAHEIRTPVSLIIGPLEQLRKTVHLEAPAALAAAGNAPAASPGVASGAAELIAVIDRNARRLLELVNQLLDFRKVAQNQHEMTFAPHNVGELLSSVADGFAPALKLSGRKLSVSLPKDHITAVLDSEAITKAVSNLLSNANKYAASRIDLSLAMQPDAHHLTIAVSDDGPGISRADLPHVFQPFYQGKNGKPGTGIGLTIVKSVVDQHHGTISIDSEPGRGTTISLVLPASQDVAAESSTPQPPQPRAEQAPAVALTAQEKPTMLIVDDNEEMLTFLATTFMDAYEVIPVRDGTEALKQLEDSLVVKDGRQPTSTIQIVVSDWMMDRMDGPELCSRMRQNPATSHIPFVLLTAKTDSQSKVQAMQAGVDAFIEKPFAVKYLEACLRNLLERNKRMEQHFAVGENLKTT